MAGELEEAEEPEQQEGPQAADIREEQVERQDPRFIFYFWFWDPPFGLAPPGGGSWGVPRPAPGPRDLFRLLHGPADPFNSSIDMTIRP